MIFGIEDKNTKPLTNQGFDKNECSESQTSLKSVSLFLPKISQFLTFVGPCIVIYFYSKTNQLHDISNVFYFGTTLYMFRTVFPSIIRSLRMYIQHQVYVIQVLWLLAGKQPQNVYDLYVMLYVHS